MDATDACLCAILVVLIILSSYFSRSETALTSVSRLRLRNLADSGNKRAALTLRLLETKQSKMLSTILIGNNIVNLSASSIAGVLATKFSGSWAVGISTAVITVVILIFGEITPKTAATLRAEKYSLGCIRTIQVLMVLFTPLIFVINGISRGLLFIMRISPDEADRQTTEDDLLTMVAVSHEDGVIQTDEKDMIENVFDLTDSLAKDVMVPRVDVACASKDITYDELLGIFAEHRFTRLPVYEENPDNVIGILNMKDVLLYRPGERFNVPDIMREAFYTHEFKNAYELFLDMRRASVTMSIVLDEYGLMVGIITMEDILEEIVGEIRDEFDTSELDEIKRIAPRVYVIEGTCKLYDVNDKIGSHLESEEYDSIGGYLLGLLDHFPRLGEEASDENGYMLKAVAVDGNRIGKVRLTLPDPKHGPASDSTDADTKAQAGE